MFHFCLFAGTEGEMPPIGLTALTIFGGTELRRPTLAREILVHRATRGEAVHTMRRALKETVAEGLKTTIPLHLAVLGNPQFIRGETWTGFLESLFAKAS